MKTSQMINELQRIMAKFGDLEVAMYNQDDSEYRTPLKFSIMIDYKPKLDFRFNLEETTFLVIEDWD